MFLALSLISTLSTQCFATNQIPEIPWEELSLDHKLGEGGFGEVYKGKWKGIDVAIKVPRLGALAEDFKNDFEQETQTMWTCQFTNVLRLIGVCKENDRYAMIIELMSGGSLYDRLHTERTTFSEKQKWDIAVRLAQGLTDLHERGVIHCVLTSKNALLDTHGRVRISDHGLLRLRKAAMVIQYPEESVRWRAPECLDSTEQVTDRSDSYSYGMILWEILTGQVPFHEEPYEMTVMELVEAGEREKIPEDCHPIWKEIIEACWDEIPMNRPSMAEILDRLKAVRPQLPRSIWLPAEDLQIKYRERRYCRTPGTVNDWEVVIGCYQKSPIQGYDIGSVEVIWNPIKDVQFLEEMVRLQQKLGDLQYLANLQSLPKAALTDRMDWELSSVVMPFSAYESEDCPDVRLMPLWYGIREMQLRSLLSAGFTNTCETYESCIGKKGTYTFPDAAYANMFLTEGSQALQSDDQLLLMSWVISYNSIPILEEDFDQNLNQPQSHTTLPYDAQYISEKQSNSSFTSYSDSFCCARKFVTQNEEQVLPRYVVKLVLSTGLDSQRIRMHDVIRSNLQALETKERRKLSDQLIAALDVKARNMLDMIRTAAEAEAEAEAEEILKQKSTQQHSRVRRDDVVIPTIAAGYEDVYVQFLLGKLTYMSTNTNERHVLRIKDLANPLFGTFDLQKCGSSSQYLQISTGFRTFVNPENSKKVEFWIVPQFVLRRDPRAKVYNDFLQTCENHRNKPFAVLFNWGGWEDLGWYEITGFVGDEFDTPLAGYRARTGPSYVSKDALFTALRTSLLWSKFCLIFESESFEDAIKKLCNLT